MEAEAGIHTCVWNPDEEDHAEEERQYEGQDKQIISVSSGSRGHGGEGGFRMPIHMVEGTYTRPAKPKLLPFRTGLLARMQAAGGVRLPVCRKPLSWIEEMLVPIFGQLRQE